MPTFDNAGFGGTAGTALQFTLTATAGSVLVVATSNPLGRSVSAIAYAGVALTKLGGTPTSTELWGLTAPAAGANTLSMQATGLAAGWTMIGLTYTNVKSIGPFRTVVSATATAATNVNLSVSAALTDTVVAFFRVNSSAAITANNGTQRASITATEASGNVYFLATELPGAATVSFSATYATAVNWQMIAVPLVHSAAAASTIRVMRALRGIGY